MDRPIASSQLKKQSQGRYAKWIAIALALIGCIYFIGQWLSPSIERNTLRTTTATLGPIAATISASGTVVPEFEQSISSPIDTRILKVLRESGDSLRQGDPIMLLDLDYVRVSMKKNSDQLSLKSNALAQLKATYQSQIIALKSTLKNTGLDRDYKKLEYEQYQKLLDKKAVAKNDFLQKKLAYEQSVNTYAETEESLTNLASSIKLQEEGLRLEVSILQSELSLLEQQLEQASMRSQRGGILTWVLNTEGASITKGQTLAKIADLSSYRVEVNVSDVHAASIGVGMPAEVKVSQSGKEVTLKGEVSNIRPTVENGVMKLIVSLKEPNHEALRPSLRVEVYLIKEAKEEALIIRTPSFASTTGRSEAFVIRGDKAVKTLLDVGMRSSEYIEIKGGINAGDEVIISDMSEYKHMSEIALK